MLLAMRRSEQEAGGKIDKAMFANAFHPLDFSRKIVVFYNYYFN